MPAVSADRQPSIEDLLAQFLVHERARLSPRTFRNYEYVVELLSHSLNGYGYQSLHGTDLRRFHQTYDAGDEEAFCHLFGAEQLVENLGEFLGYFMVRKVAAGEELLRAAGTVTKKLARWLHEGGYIDDADYEEATERGADAARDLPRAERLGHALYELARRAPDLVPDAVADKDWIEDHLQIARVEPGALWFDRGIGPVLVPASVSSLAQVGWSVTITLARLRGTWHVVEVGNVYP
jgi:hypothetical protein